MIRKISEKSIVSVKNMYSDFMENKGEKEIIEGNIYTDEELEDRLRSLLANNHHAVYMENTNIRVNKDTQFKKGNYIILVKMNMVMKLDQVFRDDENIEDYHYNLSETEYLNNPSNLRNRSIPSAKCVLRKYDKENEDDEDMFFLEFGKTCVLEIRDSDDNLVSKVNGKDLSFFKRKIDVHPKDILFTESCFLTDENIHRNQSNDPSRSMTYEVKRINKDELEEIVQEEHLKQKRIKEMMEKGLEDDEQE